jgi:muramoyltetrapeptide carboxypeptidase LdcA involved in peptidoglycan recycling
VSSLDHAGSLSFVAKRVVRRYGLPLGHGASLATLPLGVEATVDADSLNLTIDEPALLAV